MNHSVIILTYNAEHWLPMFLPALSSQQPKPENIIFIDSESNDKTVEKIKKSGFKVHSIPKREFNHGYTRWLGTQLIDSDIYVFLTQDALLSSPDAIAHLCSAFKKDKDIGVSFGRQLPHADAKPLGKHARLFNYPEHSYTRSFESRKLYGIKTCFNSDSFSAYRKSALEEIGGFPKRVIGTEDAYVAGKMLINNWKIRYEASACVYHSHDYTVTQQFKRYFDIGVFYGNETWIKENFGNANGEGWKFILSESAYLLNKRLFWLIPYALIQNIAKYLGYKLGTNENTLPLKLKRIISMNASFWRT